MKADGTERTLSRDIADEKIGRRPQADSHRPHTLAFGIVTRQALEAEQVIKRRLKADAQCPLINDDRQFRLAVQVRRGGMGDCCGEPKKKAKNEFVHRIVLVDVALTSRHPSPAECAVLHWAPQRANDE